MLDDISTSQSVKGFIYRDTLLYSCIVLFQDPLELQGMSMMRITSKM